MVLWLCPGYLWDAGGQFVILGFCTLLSQGIWRRGLCNGRVASRHGSEHAACLPWKYLEGVMSVCCTLIDM
jgi:hypothetical protein